MAVYFIRAGEDGPIKIGFSGVNVVKRLGNIQHGNHEQLRIIGLMDGDKKAEHALHRQFKADRIIGEWFNPTPELVSLASKHFKPGLEPVRRIKALPLVVREEYICPPDLARQIIKEFGGGLRLAKLMSEALHFRVPHSTVYCWQDPNKGGIRPYWHRAIIQVAEASSVVLPQSFLAECQGYIDEVRALNTARAA